MSSPDFAKNTGLAGFAESLTLADIRHPLWLRFMRSMQEELEYTRQQNDQHQDIAMTTLRRGRIELAKRILALADEVGPESEAPEDFIPAAQSPR